MVRLVTRGCFTENYAKGLVSAPEDREPAVRKLVEGAGGRLVSFYFTTGDSATISVDAPLAPAAGEDFLFQSCREIRTSGPYACALSSCRGLDSGPLLWTPFRQPL
jgi:hypothetical protein